MSSSSASKHTTTSYWSLLSIPFEDIELATNNFCNENLIKQGTTFQVYKAQLLLPSGELVNTVARKSREKILVIKELAFSQKFNHENIVSPFKVTKTDDGLFVIINKHEANGSLDRHLSSPTLSWAQRLHICLGVANALTYLHYDWSDSRYIIHGNIKSSKILLDHDWEPRLYGFGFAARAKKHDLHITSKYNGSLQYMDPAYETTGGLTHKSDVFSFGVLLFEILFGREAFIQSDDNWHFARVARSHYEKGKLDELIHPDLRNQMNLQSLNIFAETAYYCVKEQRSQRPDMNQIRHKLEISLDLQHKHEHPVVAATEDILLSNHLKGKSLDHLKLRLSDIELATHNFSETLRIGSGGYGEVYKAELDHCDCTKPSSSEGEMPNKRSTVAIKRLFDREHGQRVEGFVKEIETLSNCKHPNIISLLGFCNEGREMILVYEYATNGSLEEYLGNNDKLINFTWAQRLQICLDIAHGLNYLHTFTEDKPMIVHRDIKSANILLDDNWVAKVGDFGLSKLQTNQQGITLVTNHIAGTQVYLDPEYENTGKLRKESDIYSFGVVLFEILCGRLAYDYSYGDKGLAPVARQHFNEGTLKELVDPKLKEADGTVFVLNGGVNEDSLQTFLKIANQCLAESQSGRPAMEVIINELEKALNVQKNNKDNRRVSLKAIEAGTENFSDRNCIGEGSCWKLYEGEVALDNSGRCTPVLAKRWGSNSPQGHNQFLAELEVLLKYKHKNIIGFVGYCNEINEKIILYEHASNGRLDRHLDNPGLTWMKRLNICIDVAKGLKILHGGGVEKKGKMMHRDIRGGSILLDGDWNAKICNLEFCIRVYMFIRAEHLDLPDFSAYASLAYTDPAYQANGYLTIGSDIYSLGVILIEMLCGRLACAEGCEDRSQWLGPLVVRHYNENRNLHEMIFEGIKEQIAPQSLITFRRIALRCLENIWTDRPRATDVVIQLNKALTYQEDYEIWEPKLPVDYKEIIEKSKTPEIYDSIKMNKDRYAMFRQGILLQDSKVWFSLGSSGERNEMISAKKFSYKNRWLPRWRSLPESRFPKVAEMFDISDLKIHIKIRTQFLSPRVNYKVHLIFRFRGRRKSFQAEWMYVNLKYTMADESLNAYFAKWRDDGWMMIELFRFLNHKKDTDFEVLLESFSRCYCGSDSIYIEGVLFEAFDDASVKEDHINRGSLRGQKHEMLAANDIVYTTSKALIPSRFSGAVALDRQQVFYIMCKIKSQMLSAQNACYLVFKLSEKFCGLHGPVIVRDEFHWRRKETRILYFRNPYPWNVRDTDFVPKERQDGWMEVIVWKFNSNYDLKDDQLCVNLKLVTYEGTMSGLIVRGIEFRPF